MIFLFLVHVVFCACAGPTSPFGAIHKLTPAQKTHEHMLTGLSSANTDYEISFYPKSHIYHKDENFTVTIKGKSNLPDLKNLKFVYNNTDLTEVFIANSELKTFPDEKTLKLDFPSLKLSARQNYKIDFFYIKNKQYFAFPFSPPTCPLTAATAARGLHGFQAPPEYVGYVNRSGRETSVNPSLIAGLVAMESGFNPNAVSKAKALGLTQITDIAVEQIQSKTENWPRRDLSSLPYTQVKEEISTGSLTAKDDWRLEPMLSLKGGANYLKYILQYWNMPEHRALLDSHKIFSDADITDVILASYNSGPERVKRSIASRKKEWLTDPEIAGVRYYINMIYSYCYYFSEEPRS